MEHDRLILEALGEQPKQEPSLILTREDCKMLYKELKNYTPYRSHYTEWMQLMNRILNCSIAE